jgi:lipoyl(octanoyl) transferase
VKREDKTVKSETELGSHVSPFTCHLAPEIKFFGLVEYEPIWREMQQFTSQRDTTTPDEIWLLQHPPTFTQGQAGKPEHLLNAHAIPVIKIDRGGQITYHGPGQIVAYLLLDLRRWKINVRELVRLMEQAVIDLLAEYNIVAQGREDAPGVYINNEKIAALGLKIRNGCCYHGLSLNVDMDMAPFTYINPCGYEGLRVTQLKDFGIHDPIPKIEHQLARNLISLLQRHQTKA